MPDFRSWEGLKKNHNKNLSIGFTAHETCNRIASVCMKGWGYLSLSSGLFLGVKSTVLLGLEIYKGLRGN